MSNCLICPEPAVGGTDSYNDLCAVHSAEAKEFYSTLQKGDESGPLTIIPKDDPGSSNTGAPFDAKAAQELKVELKREFQERGTLRNVKNVETLKLSAPTIKDALRDSFIDWLRLGVPLSKTDPITLTVEFVNFRGEPTVSRHRVTDIDAKLELSQVEKINALLYDLPVLFEELMADFIPPTTDGTKKRTSMRVRGRNVRITLSWWGTLKQSTLEEVLRNPVRAVTYRRDGNTLVPIN